MDLFFVLKIVFLYAPLAVLAYAFRGLVLNYIWLVRMRLRYGRHAIYTFDPLMGAFGYQIRSCEAKQQPLALMAERMNQDNNLTAKIFISASILDRQIQFIDPYYMKQFYTEKYNLYKKTPLFMVDHVMGRGMVFSEGAEWKRGRTLLSQSFHFDQLKQHIPTLLDLCKKHVQRVKTSREFKAGEGIDGMLLAQNITGETILKRFFGCDVDQLDLPLNFNICHEVAEVFSEIIATEIDGGHNLKKLLLGKTYWESPVFGMNGIFSVVSKYQKNTVRRMDYLMGVIEKIVQDRIDHAETAALGDCLLNVLVRDHVARGKNADDKTFDARQNKRDIVHHCITFLVAGIDTTSTLIAYSLYFLAQNKDVQNKVYEELKGLNFLQSGDTDAMNKCAYTQMFLREAQRLSSLTSDIFFRDVAVDHDIGDENNGGVRVHLDRGVQVSAPLHLNLLLEQNTEKPLEFIPERWEAEKAQKYNPFWSIPFSAGPRNCIGQHLSQIEAKLILAEVLKNFEVEPNPAVEFKVVLRLVVHPSDSRLSIFRERK